MAANAGQGIIYAAILQVNGTVGGAVQLVTPATVTGTQTQTHQNATGTIALLSGAQTWTGTQDFSGATVKVTDGASFSILNTADPTKIAQFSLTGLTTATTRTYTMPNASGTVPLLSLAQAWTAQQDFTGTTALVATQAPGDNSTKAASTAFVAAAAAVTNPMTTLGDTLYENATPAPARLAGNTTTMKQYLSQTGNGTISAAPVWAQVAFADLSGSVAATQMPALTGDVTSSAGTVATTLATNQAGAHTWSAIQTISNATISTATNNGALVVTGGIGFGNGMFGAGTGGSNGAFQFAATITATAGGNVGSFLTSTVNYAGSSTGTYTALTCRCSTSQAAVSGGSIIGASYEARMLSGATTGTLTKLNPLRTTLINISAAVITTGRSLYVQSAQNSGTGSITTLYGIRVDDQTVGGTNFSISTGLGVVSFGDTTAASSTTVASVVLAGGLGVKLAIYAGGLISSTGKIKAIVAKTTTYTVTANDETVEGDATGAAFTISLPAAPATGEFHTFIKKDSTGNLVTISGNGKNINGAATYTGLSVQYNKISVQYDGTAWFIVG